MSSNLDHVLYDMQNASDRDKEINAMAFARKYKDAIDAFHKYISESIFPFRAIILRRGDIYVMVFIR